MVLGVEGRGFELTQVDARNARCAVLRVVGGWGRMVTMGRKGGREEEVVVVAVVLAHPKRCPEWSVPKPDGE